jgi:5-aminolevulinate synthase
VARAPLSSGYVSNQAGISTIAKLIPAGLPVISSDTHIVPVLVGDLQKCRRASDLLERARHLHPADQFSDRHRGTERLRITPTPFHDNVLIDELAEALVEVWMRLDLPLGGHAVAAE